MDDNVDYEEFAWKWVKPHRLERDIDEVETFYTSLAGLFAGSGRVFFAMTGHVSLSIEDSHVDDGSVSTSLKERVIESFRKAWIRLRYDCPTIASWVEYDSDRQRYRKIYEAFPDISSSPTKSQDAWVNETLHVISTHISGVEWCNSDPPVPKLPTVFLIMPSSSEVSGSDGKLRLDLVLRSHHDIIDGIGTLHLLNQLVSHAAAAYQQSTQYQLPEFGEEWRNLSPPLRIAASIPRVLSAEQKRALEQIVDYNSSLQDGVAIATMPFRPGHTVPQRHQRAALTLNIEQTAQLLRGCKKWGYSVTHVYHAAIAIVLRDLQARETHSRKIRYINYSLINERPTCKKPYNTPKHAASVYHSVSGRSLAIDLTVPGISDGNPEDRVTEVATNEFWTAAQQVKEFYNRVRNDRQHINLVPSYWARSTPAFQQSANPPVPAPNPKPSVSISSMGVVEDVLATQHSPFEIDDPWVTGEELGTGLGVFLATFKQRLSISAAYNDAWHDKEEATKFLEQCNQLVLRFVTTD